MNPHLSGEQISKCLLGDFTPQQSQHVSSCPACRGEVARLESSLSQFRGSVRRWSDRVSATDGAIPWNVRVEVATLKGLYGGHETIAGVGSLIIHVAAVGLLLFVGSLPPVQKAVKEFVPIFAPNLQPLQPKPKPEQSKGGGGSPQKTAETKGELPKVAPKSFIPLIRPQEDPKLALNPTIVAPDMPNINSPNYGNPLAGLGIPSAGNGIGAGIGSGKGPGVGPGSGGGFGGSVYRIGGGVSAPVPVYRPEPEYSEEARKAKWQGAVLLELVVDENGVPQNIKVLRSLGLGLDQKAIEAVQKWRFKPGQKDGKPVPVSANIEVNFRLL
jgi:periplasmic protein TonB